MYFSDYFIYLFKKCSFIRISPFLQAGHRGQPYTYDAKVKKCVQWIKAKTDAEIKNTVMGGYYPYPPVPETFSKYSRFIRGIVVIVSSFI